MWKVIEVAVFLAITVSRPSDAEDVPCACMEEDKPIGCGNIDCCAIQAEGATKSGIYVIHPYVNNRSQAVKVYCDMETEGGGWTLFQRREEVQGPFETFHRDFKSYENGFGQLKYSFWLGLQHIRALTAGMDQSVRFDLTSWTREKKYANYGLFYVTPGPHYDLRVQDYTGTAGDAMDNDSPNGVSFTTYDRDLDGWTNNCATNTNYFTGGFWYRACSHIYLNTIYGRNGSSHGLYWVKFSANLMRSEIKVRNKNFPNGCAPRKTNATSI